MINKFLTVLTVLATILPFFCFYQYSEIPKNATETTEFAIESDGNVNEHWIKETELNYSLIPENIRVSYQNDNGRIYVSDKDLAKKIGLNFKIEGYYYYGTNSLGEDFHEIYIEGRKDAVDGILHEVGHYVDHKCNDISLSDEFKVIHNAEVENFSERFIAHENNYSTPDEYFAEAFKQYILNPNILIKTCPETYEFLDNVIVNFEQLY